MTDDKLWGALSLLREAANCILEELDEYGHAQPKTVISLRAALVVGAPDDFMSWLDKRLKDHNGMLDEVAYDAIEKLSVRYSAVPKEVRP